MVCLEHRGTPPATPRTPKRASACTWNTQAHLLLRPERSGTAQARNHVHTLTRTHTRARVLPTPRLRKRMAACLKGGRNRFRNGINPPLAHARISTDLAINFECRHRRPGTTVKPMRLALPEALPPETSAPPRLFSMLPCDAFAKFMRIHKRSVGRSVGIHTHS